MKHKSTLAKLLAKENITVQYGNYQTAWFDIKDRVLGLPQWKDMGKDVTDLLIGHEVGHALYTPFEGWHDSPEKLEGCPRSYINVIEDARIERHIKQNYAGLVGPMARGYKKLFDDEFFGDLSDIDWDEIKLIDKINLKAKIGVHLDVPMNDEEIVFYNRAMTTETFEEVTQLCRDILAYTKENQENLLKPPASTGNNQEQENENEDPTQNMGHDDMESTGGDDEYTRDQVNRDSETEEESTESADGSSGESNSGTEQSETSGRDGETYKDEDISVTDETFRRQEHKLLDRDKRGYQTKVGNEFRKEVRDKIVIPYQDLAGDRIASTNLDEYEHYRASFKTYMKEVKRNVNYAVKEFEMRKAAYRYTRAQTARTGSLDVNRLWSYKTNDDIFARVTRLADAKNHGMMMLIDYSGSMSNTMGQVMDQLLHLAVFCKTVNIPFDVYGFTTGNPRLGYERYSHEGIPRFEAKESEVNHCGISMPQIVSSSLKKADYLDAMFHIYLRKILCEDEYSYAEREILSRFEDYGSTPLNEALIISHRLIKTFKAKNNIDKMNLVILSDGDANKTQIAQSYDIKYVESDGWGESIIHIDGSKVTLQSRGKGGTISLLENIQKKFDTQTLGFFVADGSYNWWNKIGDAERNGDGFGIYGEDRKPYNREYQKHKCVTFKDTLGYNEFYIVKNGKNFSTDDDGFDVAEDASKGQIASQFKKYSKSKKNNKTLLTNFGKAVA